MKKLLSAGISGLALGVSVTDPARAMVTGGVDPTTILQNGFTLITGDIGRGVAVLGLIGTFCLVSRIGLMGVLMYVVLLAGIFGSAYIGQTLIGG
jgi:type IV secretory pathway VirB2 component (pilin)